MCPANWGPSEKLAQTNVVMNECVPLGQVVKDHSVDVPCRHGCHQEDKVLLGVLNGSVIANKAIIGIRRQGS